MNKKVIGIDINEILRAFWMQFDRYYVDEFGEEGAPDEENAYVYDFFKHYKWEDIEEEQKFLNEDLPEDINPLDYQLDENGESKIDFLAFKTETQKLTAREVYNRFMYQDFLFELFASAPKMYPHVDKDAEKFFMKYKDQFEVIIISKENWFSISPTLFFLSKLMPKFKMYFFGETNEEIWDKVDILVTTDPELLNKPSRKKVIKLNRPYNENLESDYDTTNLVDLVEDEKFQKLIRYKK